MKNILITQSVSFTKNQGFSFFLSNNWYDYAKKINVNLIPYDYNFSKKQIKRCNLNGVIFSGGNDLHKKRKKKENLFRDYNETKLLKYLIKKKYPIIGICRGFQLIANLYNSKIIKINNHVKVNHSLIINNSNFIKTKILKTNSFHNYCVRKLPNRFNIISRCCDGTIEIAENVNNNLLCMMFHPERKNISQNQINKFIKKFFDL